MSYKIIVKRAGTRFNLLREDTETGDRTTIQDGYQDQAEAMEIALAKGRQDKDCTGIRAED